MKAVLKWMMATMVPVLIVVGVIAMLANDDAAKRKARCDGLFSAAQSAHDSILIMRAATECAR